MAEDLFDEEGVSFGLGEDGAGEVRPLRSVPGPDQFGNLGLRQAPQRDSLDELLAAEVRQHLGQWMAARELALPVSAEDHQGAAPQRPCDVFEQQEGGFVGPVQVVEDEQNGAVA